MKERGFHTIAQQVAAHLREEIGRGRWSACMPGRLELARDLGISDQTAEAGLMILEKEGMLVPQGAGRRRRIELPESVVGTSSLRVAILVGEQADRRRDYLVAIKHELAEAGHSPFFTPWFMPELGINVGAIRTSHGAARRSHTSRGTPSRWCGGRCAGRETSRAASGM